MRNVFLLVGVVWLLALASLTAQEDRDKAPQAAQGKPVALRGTLRTGIVAIGGETTGIILETKQGTFELSLGRNSRLHAVAEKLDGKRVDVTGTLRVREGVEVRQRRIITVNSLKPAQR